MLPMLCAALLFVVAHLGVSSTGVRAKWVAKLGEQGYLGVFSLLALLTLGLLIWTYTSVPRHVYWWPLDPALYLVPKLLMPIALILAVGGFMVRNPTTVGMEGTLADPEQADRAVRGVNRITRHPFQWGVILWALAHVIANPDAVSVIFFAAFLALSGLGTVLLDRKKAAAIGAAWQPFAQRTSNVPFLAVVAGRNRLVLRELVAPVVAGLVVYALLFWGHQWVSGVRII